MINLREAIIITAEEGKALLDYMDWPITKHMTKTTIKELRNSDAGDAIIALRAIIRENKDKDNERWDR